MTLRWKVALAVSLGLNLFFAGFALARHWRTPDAFEPGRHARDRFTEGHRGGGPFGAEPWTVPPLRRIWREHREEFATELEELRSARQRVMAEFDRDNLDKAALERALSELRQRTDTLQQKLHHTLVESAADLSVEERRRLRSTGQRGRDEDYNRRRGPRSAEPPSEP